MRKPYITIKLFQDTGSLKAFADITMDTKFGEITIHRFKVLQEDDKRPWVAFPQVAYDKLFQTHYWPLITVSKRLERRIKRLILNEYRKASE